MFLIRSFRAKSFLGVAACAVVSGAAANPLPLVDTDFHDDGFPAAAQVRLGQQLFFDKILSGNANISCASCHHPLAGSGDGLALPVGEGGRGLGVTRDTGGSVAPIHERVPRNAPALFNLGADEFSGLFHDGRLKIDPSQPSGFANPAGDDLPLGLNNVLAAQAMFPVTSAAEMAGQPPENAVAVAAAAGDLAGPEGVWALLAGRLQEIPDYVSQFVEVYRDVGAASDITFVHVANAIAAFEAVAFRADDSPYDRYLKGDRGALSRAATRGLELFNGDAGCVTCHAGALQTNHGFAAIAVPQIGPGKGDGMLGRDDFGLERVTGRVEDRYRFRVPSLRNVALTGPWGHDGAFDSLKRVVQHHLDPVLSMGKFDPADARLPPRDDLDAIDGWIHAHDPSREALLAASELTPRTLTDDQLDDLMAFLHALTDPSSVDQRALVPSAVPSGLPIFD